MEAKYDSYSGSSDEQNYDNIELKFTPHTTVTGVIEKVFGTQSQFGQSLGLNLRDVELEDGALYADPDKEKFKVFSWKDVAGLSISESLERGNEPSVDDAQEVMNKTYVGNDKTYELVAARVPEVTAPDGDVVLEASSKQRDVTLEDGSADFGEWEDLDGDYVEIGETVSWYDGSEDYGPSAASKSILQTTSHFGGSAVVDEDDIHNWLPDTSGSSILRDDLEDRRIRFFTVTRESENGFTYHAPIFEDLATEERIVENNRENDSEEMTDAKAADDDERSYPEPVADFISSGRNLNLNESRAENLLDELLEDSDNSLTEGMLEDSGGRDNVVSEVL